MSIKQAIEPIVTAFMQDERGMFLEFRDGTRRFYKVEIDHEISDDCPTPSAPTAVEPVQRWSVSQDPLTQLQVAAIISERDADRASKGTPL